MCLHLNSVDSASFRGFKFSQLEMSGCSKFKGKRNFTNMFTSPRDHNRCPDISVPSVSTERRNRLGDGHDSNTSRQRSAGATADADGDGTAIVRMLLACP